MTLGRYVNTNSKIHSLDPRNKFILLFIFMIIIFVNNSWTGYLFLILLAFIIFKLAKLKFSMIFNSLKPMWFMMLFLFIVNLFVYKDGTLLLSFWKINIYSSAIIQWAKIALRLILLISFSTIFTATTKPLEITIAIEDLFSFLKVFHINVHIFSMTISIALRFIPTILDETYRIMKAQASRGVDFKNGKFKEKVVAISSLIIPLFISAFSRSNDLANAMEARNYNPLGKRTRYRNLLWHKKDTITILLTTFLFATIVFLKIYFKDNEFDIFILNNIKNLLNIIKGWFIK